MKPTTQKKKVVSFGTLNPKEAKRRKKQKIIFIIISALFLLAGAASGLAGLILSGWNFIDFITDSRLFLASFILITVAIIIAPAIFLKKENAKYYD